MEQMIIAHITDPHLRSDGKMLRDHVDSVAAMNAAIEHLNALRPLPDVTVLTGDLVNEAKDYVGLRHMLEDLDMPCYVIPGNHDFPHELRDVFSGHGYLPEDGEFLHYTVEDLPLRLVMLDTSVPEVVWGAMCEKRLDWLDARLTEQPERPTVICMHHPPVKTGVSFMDKHGLQQGTEAMKEVVSAHSQVERVLCGHVHRAVNVPWAGTLVSVAPALSFQMLFDLREDIQSGYVMEPAACAVYLWRDDIGLAGHLSVIGDYGPVRRFNEDNDG